MNYEESLNKLKNDLERSKELRYQAEARLEQLNNQEKQIIEELDKLNVKPEDLDSEIKRLNEEINKLFEEANNYLPKDILDKM